jgi:hypothetical protein
MSWQVTALRSFRMPRFLRHDLGALLGIAQAALALEQLAIDVLQVQFGRPAEALGVGHGDGVAVVDLAEQEGVGGVDDQAAEHARHGVGGQHRARAGAASRDHEVGRAGVEQNPGQQAVHHIGQRGLILGAYMP